MSVAYLDGISIFFKKVVRWNDYGYYKNIKKIVKSGRVGVTRSLHDELNFIEKNFVQDFVVCSELFTQIFDPFTILNFSLLSSEKFRKPTSESE